MNYESPECTAENRVHGGCENCANLEVTYIFMGNKHQIH